MFPETRACKDHSETMVRPAPTVHWVRLAHLARLVLKVLKVLRVPMAIRVVRVVAKWHVVRGRLPNHGAGPSKNYCCLFKMELFF